jgi:uncharacterized protein (TIGR02145 family)
MNANSILISLLLLSQLVVAQDNAIRKVALVIGIRAYQKVAPLQNSVNDAKDMAVVLKSKGFNVIEIYDAKTKRDLQDGIRTYYEKLHGGGSAVGLLYYSGHGIQVDGVNYLMPTTADPQIKADMDDQCLNMDYIMQALEQASNALNIFIIDACRNSPFRSFGRSAEKGLSMVNAPKGSYIVYSTKPGSVASDGTGRNGLFTSKLLKYLNTPDLNIEQVFKKVANDVSVESGDAQRPWISSDYTGDFYFTPGKMPFSKQQLTSNNPPLTKSEYPISKGVEKNPEAITETFDVNGKAWMSGNFNGTRFSNGEEIPQAKSLEEWKKAATEKKPAWCFYNNDPVNEKSHGKLYNWYAVIDARGLAPAGWHIATDAEWSELITSFGGASAAGKKLKSKTEWNAIGSGNNESGMEALPSGIRNSSGKFVNQGVDASFWSSTESSIYSAWFRYFPCCSNNIDRLSSKKDYGMSVRCVKD